VDNGDEVLRLIHHYDELIHLIEIDRYSLINKIRKKNGMKNVKHTRPSLIDELTRFS
jgi:hypothetical protein